MANRNIVICCGFFESTIPSFREYQYAKQLASRGFNVTVVTSTASHIWRLNRSGLKPRDPAALDASLLASGVRIIRVNPLFRVGDLVMFRIPLQPLRDATIIHVLDFRQGVTCLCAMLGWWLKRPVVYDHEQRGDRRYTVLHVLDSWVRRTLIGLGSLFVDVVRHTVHVNGGYYRRCCWRPAPLMQLAPLGVDTEIFYYDRNAGRAMRKTLGISDDAKVAVLSGRLGEGKRSTEAVAACVKAGFFVLVIGEIARDSRSTLLASLHNGRGAYVGGASSDGVRAAFSAADIAVFTTFSVSYWEALATGADVLVPETSFSLDIGREFRKLHLFGRPTMFLLEEEVYRKEADVQAAIKEALVALKLPSDRQRKSDTRVSWETRISTLLDAYERAESISCAKFCRGADSVFR